MGSVNICKQWPPLLKTEAKTEPDNWVWPGLPVIPALRRIVTSSRSALRQTKTNNKKWGPTEDHYHTAPERKWAFDSMPARGNVSHLAHETS